MITNLFAAPLHSRQVLAERTANRRRRKRIDRRRAGYIALGRVIRKTAPAVGLPALRAGCGRILFENAHLDTSSPAFPGKPYRTAFRAGRFICGFPHRSICYSSLSQDCDYDTAESLICQGIRKDSGGGKGDCMH